MRKWYRCFKTWTCQYEYLVALFCKCRSPYTIHCVTIFVIQIVNKKITQFFFMNTLLRKEKCSNYTQAKLSFTPLGRIEECKSRKEKLSFIQWQTTNTKQNLTTSSLFLLTLIKLDLENNTKLRKLLQISTSKT